jgi:hypothetical protein
VHYHQRRNLPEMICRQSYLGPDTDAPAAKLAEQRVVLK